MSGNGSAPGLRNRRLAANLTQQALAHEAQCSIAMLKLLERGFEPERSQVLPRIIGALARIEAEHEGAQ